jgi:hypothetical protein
MIHEIMQSKDNGHSPSFAGGGDSDLSLSLRRHFPGCNVPQPASAACLLHVHSMEVCQVLPIRINAAQLDTHIKLVKLLKLSEYFQ